VKNIMARGENTYIPLKVKVQLPCDQDHHGHIIM